MKYFRHINMRLVTAGSCAFALAIAGCSSGTETETERQARWTAGNLTTWETEHGIGPITEDAKVGALDLAKAAAGKELFIKKCATCHYLAHRKTDPALRAITKRRSNEYILNQILNPEQMGKLHDQMKESGYTGHPLELYMVRLLFCLFAEDTGIFDRQQFKEYSIVGVDRKEHHFQVRLSLLDRIQSCHLLRVKLPPLRVVTRHLPELVLPLLEQHPHLSAAGFLFRSRHPLGQRSIQDGYHHSGGVAVLAEVPHQVLRCQCQFGR